ncbi:acyl-CoA dehydrogenase [Variovorax sp. UC122_21]|uniref:acyl-CoA dehydrogenase n=1 Tax=Variovorax TaxID=34072 RepID=UPI001932E004|nr:acyl-CoA dehydrogenase [Variovorax paradoxus]
MLVETDAAWLAAQAHALDSDASLAAEVVPRLARAGLFAHGVPEHLGGLGGKISLAIESVAQVASLSLSAAFVLWAQCVMIQMLSQSDRTALRDLHVERLMAGRTAGAPGLSNIIKFLSGIEAINVVATPAPHGGWTLKGTVPWCTNLRRERFLVAIAVAKDEGGPPMIVALPSDRTGLMRSGDLDLIALRGTNTASITLDAVQIESSDLLADIAPTFLPRVRPVFLGLQCGLSIGLARASVAQALQNAASAEHILAAPIKELAQRLEATADTLKSGVDNGTFVDSPHRLFRLRLELNACVQEAIQFELQASGGRAFLRRGDFIRRWRESAFIPIVTPSVTQLLAELAKHPTRSAAAGNSSGLF